MNTLDLLIVRIEMNEVKKTTFIYSLLTLLVCLEWFLVLTVNTDHFQ